MTTWLPQLVTAVASLIAGAFAYLATRRGDVAPARRAKRPDDGGNGNGNGNGNGKNGDTALLRGLVALYEQARAEKQALEIQVAEVSARLAECEKRRAARGRAKAP